MAFQAAACSAIGRRAGWARPTFPMFTPKARRASALSTGTVAAARSIGVLR
jgi:hypothetical protein